MTSDDIKHRTLFKHEENMYLCIKNATFKTLSLQRGMK